MKGLGDFIREESSQNVRSRGRLWTIVLLTVAALFSAGAVVAAISVPGLLIDEPEPANSPGGGGDEEAAQPPERDDGAVTVLLMGLDDEEATGGEPVRTDTLMLARVDPETGKTTLISIPRDLYVEDVTSDGGSDRINSAYAYGGANRTVEAVEGLTDVDVDHHVVANFKGFEDIVDSLGGVEVNVEGDYLAHKEIPAGEQTLDGEEALLYARYRDTPAGDLGRIERQQELLASLREQALSWNSIASIPGVIRSLDKNVETDMGAGEMVSLGHTLAQNGQDGGFESAQLQGEPLTLTDGREVLVPVEEANERILRESLG